VSSLPDSICNLSNLQYISLVDNKELTTIPDCLVDLPDLVFVNLKGSDNVIITDRFKDAAEFSLPGFWEFIK
jgi:Leucine-rich repeat (LRR) protein